MKMRWIALSVIFFTFAIFIWRGFPKVSVLRTNYPLMIYQGAKDSSKIVFSRKRPDSWIAVSSVSKIALVAIVMSEDSAFYQHKGIDPKQIKEAFETNIRKKRFVRGASTITQQVVRNLFLDRDKNLWRKVKEMVIALRLERALSKPKILEIYMNIAEWGPGIYGIRAASKYYFGKNPSELTAKEGAFLAMLLPNPKKNAQSYRQRWLTDYASHRINSILEKMAQAQYLSQEEYDRERSSRLLFN